MNRSELIENICEVLDGVDGKYEINDMYQNKESIKISHYVYVDSSIYIDNVYIGYIKDGLFYSTLKKEELEIVLNILSNFGSNTKNFTVRDGKTLIFYNYNF